MSGPVAVAPTAPPSLAGSSVGPTGMLRSDGSRKGDAGLASTKRNRSRQPGSTALTPSATPSKKDLALAVSPTNPPAGGFRHHLDAVTANIEARASTTPLASNTSAPLSAKRTSPQRTKRQLALQVSPPATGIPQAATSPSPLPVTSATSISHTAPSLSVKPTPASQGPPVGEASIPLAGVVQAQQSRLSSIAEPTVRVPIQTPNVDRATSSTVGATSKGGLLPNPAALQTPSAPPSGAASASLVPTTVPSGGKTAQPGGPTLVAVNRTAQPTQSVLDSGQEVSKGIHQLDQVTSSPAMASLLSGSVVSAQTAVAHTTAAGPASPTLPVPTTPGGTTTPPAQQILAVLSPILTTANGTHRISLELHPAELGSIQATITVSGGQVTVELHADNAATRQAIGSALPDLRQQLGSGGQQAHVFFGGDAPRRQTGYSDRRLGVTSDSSAGAQPTQILIRSAKSASSVDIRL